MKAVFRARLLGDIFFDSKIADFLQLIELPNPWEYERTVPERQIRPISDKRDLRCPIDSDDISRPPQGGG